MTLIEPKAELHVHLEGTARPALAVERARRAGIDLGDLVDGPHYRWSGFSEFLAAYDRIAALFVTPQDYSDLAYDYLASIAQAGALYCEITVSPDHARMAGLDPRDYVRAVMAGAERAEREHAITARLTVVGVRHLGPDAVREAARFAADPSLPGITGFGLAGDERMHMPADFAPAFDLAREAGLGLTAHAGEFAGWQGVAQTLDALKVSRIGHGVRAIESAELVARLAAEGIVLECCPGSNVSLGVYPELAAHPLRRLHDAGVRVTVNSDDPPFFGTDLAQEYENAQTLGFSAGERLALTRNAIEAAFVDEPTRARLLERLALSAISLGAPGASE